MLPVRGLDALAHEVHAVTDAYVAKPEHRPFKGHLTVGRARGSKGEVPKSLAGEACSASWTATSFVLVRSQTKPSGAVYTDLETFPLV
jgi:2'-5' RNA ligase